LAFDGRLGKIKARSIFAIPGFLSGGCSGKWAPGSFRRSGRFFIADRQCKTVANVFHKHDQGGFFK
jgi:hypothetical protein